MGKQVVDKTIARAFADGRKAKGNNTVCDGSAVYLHGHRIAWKDGVPSTKRLGEKTCAN